MNVDFLFWIISSLIKKINIIPRTVNDATSALKLKLSNVPSISKLIILLKIKYKDNDPKTIKTKATILIRASGTIGIGKLFFGSSRTFFAFGTENSL